MTVDGEQFYFIRGLETLLRNSFTVALTSNSDTVVVMTVHFSSLEIMQVVTQCQGVPENVTTIQAAGKLNSKMYIVAIATVFHTTTSSFLP